MQQKETKKANQDFVLLKSIWRFTGLNIHTYISVFNINVLKISVILYGSNAGGHLGHYRENLNA